jgi:hypothetical protein
LRHFGFLIRKNCLIHIYLHNDPARRLVNTGSELERKKVNLDSGASIADAYEELHEDPFFIRQERH